METNGSPELDLSEYDPAEIRRAAKLALYNQDLDLFCRNEVKIVTKAMGLRPLIPYEWQSEFIQASETQLKETGRIRQIWFKCRQPGGTSLAAAILSRLLFLNHNVHGFTVAQDKTTVSNIFDIYNTVYENLSDDLKPMRQYFTKGTEMVLGNPNARLRTEDQGLNSRLIVGEAKNVHVGTGFTIHALHLSELARYQSVYSIKDALIPAFSDGPGTIGIIESTAHWAAGSEMMKSLCERAIRGEGSWEYHFLKWWLQPEYQIPLEKGEIFKTDLDEKHLFQTVPRLSLENLKWRRKKIEDMDGDIYTFRSNYPFTFEEGWIPSGHSCFPVDRLLEMKADLRPPMKRCELTAQGEMYDAPEDGKLSIWHMPEPGKQYDIGSDVAEGMDDGDWSVAEVIERGTNRQVAEWRGHIDPHEFGDVLYHLGMFYNVAQIAPEVEKYGLQVVVRLQELNYPNLFIWLKRDTVTPKFTNYFGWSTTHASKLILVSLTRHLIWNREIRVYSEQLWHEMMNFMRDTTPSGLHTYNAASGCNDDAIMSFMIALRISKDEMAYRMEGEFQSKHDRIDDKYGAPAIDERVFRDAEGLKPAGVHSWQEELKAW